MSEEFITKNLLKRDYFKSYSEFYFMLSISKVLFERGMSLDMNNVFVDTTSIMQDYIKYYKKLVSVGAIKINLSTRPDSVVVEDSKLEVTIDYFKNLNLFYEKDGVLNWDMSYARENYGEYANSFLELLTMGGTLLHLVAYHIVSVLMGEETKKLVIHFDEQRTKSTFIYVNIYSCIYSLPWISEFVELDLDLGDTRVDLDYSILCNNSKMSGHRRILALSEKIDLMKKFGIVENSIVALWKRSGMCDNNEFGKIEGVDIIQVREIGEDFIGVTKISLNKTKEEVTQDFFDIPEKDRHLFVDILDKNPYQKDFILELSQVGIDDYFYDEDKFVMLLDNVSQVTKLITVNGKQVNKEMSEVDSIYWLLCQYNIEFDKDLYKDMYMGSKDTLWDIVSES